MEENIKLQLQLAASIDDGFREEEFYEQIEAPKFVDFTIPDHYSPDDRYWFCSRVGCDQRHEEEMDSETIYRNFVLRVMAARSPNVRLRKALTRRTTGETKKCPLSAPPKPSKSRLPRLAIAASISKKLVLDEKDTNKPPSEKPCSTPQARVKHVAAKYMTSVKKKKGSPPSPNAFRSVRNPKRTSIILPKSKVVTKALVFNSPKKAQKAKASEEMATPITKLCEGIKKMQITQKPSKECRSVRKALPLDAPKKQPRSPRKNDPKFSRNISSKANRKDEKTVQSEVQVAKTRNDSSDVEVDGKSRAGSIELHSETVKSKVEKAVEANSVSSGSGSGSGSSQEVTGSENTLTGEMTSLSDPEDRGSALDNSVSYEASKGDDQSKTKEDNVAADDVENQNPGTLGEVTNNQAIENGLKSDNIRNVDGGNLRKHDAPVKHKSKTVEKTLKENCSAGMQGVKYRKLKPTNPKPFRLRTDERGILKEATLERKADSNENATTASENLQERGILKEATLERKADSNENATTASENLQCTGNELSENGERENKKERGKSFNQNQLRPIKSKYMSTSKVAKPKPDKGLVLCSEKSIRPQREAVSQLKSRLAESKPTTTKLKEPRKASNMAVNPSQAPKVARMLAAQGRRAVTIPKEPNFHHLHKPKSCIKDTA